jgi:hypothetical protein
MARGDVLMRGATPQEKAINPDQFIEELARRNIVIKESVVFAEQSPFGSINKKELLIARSSNY